MKKNRNSVTTDEIHRFIDEFEVIFRDKVDSVGSLIKADKNTAPEYYIADMNGYHRGLIEMGNRALSFFKNRLLDSEYEVR